MCTLEDVTHKIDTACPGYKTAPVWNKLVAGKVGGGNLWIIRPSVPGRRWVDTVIWWPTMQTQVCKRATKYQPPGHQSFRGVSKTTGAARRLPFPYNRKHRTIRTSLSAQVSEMSRV